jgi:hypothetical protein
MREASRDFPRLAWLNGKTYSSSMGSRKNRPGRKPEQTEALLNKPEETTNEAAPVSPDIAS